MGFDVVKDLMGNYKLGHCQALSPVGVQIEVVNDTIDN